MKKISIVFPAKSLKSDKLIIEAINRYKAFDLEIIVVTSDETDTDLNGCCQLYFLKTNSRAKRLNLGITKTTGDMIILHHPRSILDLCFYQSLLNSDSAWGAFTHEFDEIQP